MPAGRGQSEQTGHSGYSGSGIVAKFACWEESIRTNRPLRLLRIRDCCQVCLLGGVNQNKQATQDQGLLPSLPAGRSQSEQTGHSGSGIVAKFACWEESIRTNRPLRIRDCCQVCLLGGVNQNKQATQATQDQGLLPSLPAGRSQSEQTGHSGSGIVAKFACGEESIRTNRPLRIRDCCQVCLLGGVNQNKQATQDQGLLPSVPAGRSQSEQTGHSGYSGSGIVAKFACWEESIRTNRPLRIRDCCQVCLLGGVNQNKQATQDQGLLPSLPAGRSQSEQTGHSGSGIVAKFACWEESIRTNRPLRIRDCCQVSLLEGVNQNKQATQDQGLLPSLPAGRSQSEQTGHSGSGIVAKFACGEESIRTNRPLRIRDCCQVCLLGGVNQNKQATQDQGLLPSLPAGRSQSEQTGHSGYSGSGIVAKFACWEESIRTNRPLRIRDCCQVCLRGGVNQNKQATQDQELLPSLPAGRSQSEQTGHSGSGIVAKCACWEESIRTNRPLRLLRIRDCCQVCLLGGVNQNKQATQDQGLLPSLPAGRSQSEQTGHSGSGIVAKFACWEESIRTTGHSGSGIVAKFACWEESIITNRPLRIRDCCQVSLLEGVNQNKQATQDQGLLPSLPAGRSQSEQTGHSGSGIVAKFACWKESIRTNRPLRIRDCCQVCLLGGVNQNKQATQATQDQGMLPSLPAGRSQSEQTGHSGSGIVAKFACGEESIRTNRPLRIRDCCLVCLLGGVNQNKQATQATQDQGLLPSLPAGRSQSEQTGHSGSGIVAKLACWKESIRTNRPLRIRDCCQVCLLGGVNQNKQATQDQGMLTSLPAGRSQSEQTGHSGSGIVAKFACGEESIRTNRPLRIRDCCQVCLLGGVNQNKQATQDQGLLPSLPAGRSQSEQTGHSGSGIVAKFACWEESIRTNRPLRIRDCCQVCLLGGVNQNKQATQDQGLLPSLPAGRSQSEQTGHSGSGIVAKFACGEESIRTNRPLRIRDCCQVCLRGGVNQNKQATQDQGLLPSLPAGRSQSEQTGHSGSGIVAKFACGEESIRTNRPLRIRDCCQVCLLGGVNQNKQATQDQRLLPSLPAGRSQSEQTGHSGSGIVAKFACWEESIRTNRSLRIRDCCQVCLRGGVNQNKQATQDQGLLPSLPAGRSQSEQTGHSGSGIVAKCACWEESIRTNRPLRLLRIRDCCQVCLLGGVNQNKQATQDQGLLPSLPAWRSQSEQTGHSGSGIVAKFACWEESIRTNRPLRLLRIRDCCQVCLLGGVNQNKQATQDQGLLPSLPAGRSQSEQTGHSGSGIVAKFACWEESIRTNRPLRLLRIRDCCQVCLLGGVNQNKQATQDQGLLPRRSLTNQSQTSA